jgi:transposase
MNRPEISNLGLEKTKMTKFVLDADWGQMKTMLSYKCNHAGIVFEKINEKYTTKTGSSCGSGIREWACNECGDIHERDIHAVKNILALGHEHLAVGIPH